MISPARIIAYQVLHRVEQGHGFASDLLRTDAPSLSDADQGLATEIVMGTLRRRAQLDLWIERLSGRSPDALDPEIAIILRLGIYQIRWLQRVPKRAAVNEAVELAKAVRKRSATGLVNAVLRKCEPIGRAADGIEPDSIRLALPAWLNERWTAQFGADAASALARATLDTPRVAIRIARLEVEHARSQLASEGIALSPAAYARHAFIVERGRITRSSLWRHGTVVIQDEASQLVGSLLAPAAGHRVLDLCAAPGLKTSQLAEGLGDGLLVACDRSSRRLHSMGATVRRLLPATARWQRVQLDAASPLPFGTTFDRVLLDAPCSGTGTLGRNPEIKWRLKPVDIERLAEKQRRMLANALGAVKPGGRLVYATCSLQREENELVVESTLASAPGFRMWRQPDLVKEFPAIATLVDDQGYFRTRPDLHGTDGFCAAVIERLR